MKQVKTKQKKSYQLTAVDFSILQLIHEYHFLTAQQIVRLRYSKNSLPTAQTRLKALADNKYLERRKLPSTDPGNKDYIYYLSSKGQHELEAAGYTGFARVRKSEIEDMKFPHLQHVLDLNDVLIAARLLTRDVPYIQLVEMRHDLDLKKTPVKVTVERRMPYGDRIDEKITVIPDGWLDFRMDVLNLRRCIVLELDRGTTSIAPFKQKLRALFAYAISDEFKELYGTDICLVAYATTAGRQRLQSMIEWCEQELEQQRLQQEAILYRFTALPDGEINPQELFCTPVWYKPYEQEPVSLLWQV